MNKRIVGDVAKQAAAKIVKRLDLEHRAWAIIASLIEAAIRLAFGCHARMHKRLNPLGVK